MQQLAPSGIGSSERGQRRILIGGGMLPSGNGVALDTYEQKRPFLSTSLNV